MSPSDDEHRHPLPLLLSDMPAAPRPARLPRLRAEGSPVVPSTPPRISRLHDGASSPRPLSVHQPIPRIPDYEELAENESDSDDELFHLARLRAAGTIVPASPVLSTPGSSTVGGAEGTSLSPLSSLINRIGSIGRTSPLRPAHPCGTPEAACSTEDLAAAAHRADVRRLMLKMMQDELESEQKRQQQLQQMLPPRAYKRSSMSTIKEDPADVSGTELEVPKTTVATLDGSGPSVPFEYTFTKSKEDLSIPSILAKKNIANGKFVLPKPPALPAPASSRSSSVLQRGKSVLPRGFGLRGRLRTPPTNGLKDWVLTSLSIEREAGRPPSYLEGCIKVSAI
ncbi:hypothetical protein SBRCBS47491_007012 [Sporothrix bragantina]|uniref:Uncharacterized protein n=1 Tax=Sporothrix bragantina TaxID=671064 RepID=A0ABP0CAU3_9PEZI